MTDFPQSGYPALPQTGRKTGKKQPQRLDFWSPEGLEPAIKRADSLEDLDSIIMAEQEASRNRRAEEARSWKGFKFYADDWGGGIPVQVQLEPDKAQELARAGRLYQVRSELGDIVDQVQDVLIETSGTLQDLQKPEKRVSATRFLLDVARFSPAWDMVQWGGMRLPAREEPLFSCGKWLMRGCLNTYEHPEEKVYLEMVTKECCRSRCNMCVESWTNRLANRITKRLFTFMDFSHKKPSHVVISVPERLWNQPMKVIKKELKTICKEVGILGAAVIIHPFRFKKDGKATPYVSPHFHLLCFGWIVKTEETYEKTGWIVHKIRTLYDEAQIFRNAKYLLTHAGVKKRAHSVVYQGCLSYSKWKIPKEEKEPYQCPYCPLEVVPLRIKPEHSDRPPPVEPGFTGLTDWNGLEEVGDFNYHFYDDEWTMFSSRQAALEKEAHEEMREAYEAMQYQAIQKRKSENQGLAGFS